MSSKCFYDQLVSLTVGEVGNKIGPKGIQVILILI